MTAFSAIERAQFLSAYTAWNQAMENDRKLDGQLAAARDSLRQSPASEHERLFLHVRLLEILQLFYASQAVQHSHKVDQIAIPMIKKSFAKKLHG